MTNEPKLPNDTAFDSALLDAEGDVALAALTQAGASAPRLVEAWTKRSNAAALSEVATHGTGAARKAARRGLNVLRSRGVKIPERQHVASLTGGLKEVVHEAWMVPPDGSGRLMLAIAVHAPTRRSRVVFIQLHDLGGVLRVDVGEMSASTLKEALQRTVAGTGQKPVKVPAEWARVRIAQARARQSERGLVEPLGMTNASALLMPVPETPPEHPFDAEGLELSDEDAEELSKSSANLHMLPEFASWLPDRQSVDELLAKVGEKLTPGEEPAQELLESLIREEIASATDRYFSPEAREQLLSLMKDAALAVLAREGEVRALQVVAAMMAVRKAGLITDPPHEVPFLRAFFDKAVGILIAQSGGRLRIPVRAAREAAQPEASSAEGEPAADAAPPPEASENEGSSDSG